VRSRPCSNALIASGDFDVTGTAAGAAGFAGSVLPLPLPAALPVAGAVVVGVAGVGAGLSSPLFLPHDAASVATARKQIVRMAITLHAESPLSGGRGM